MKTNRLLLTLLLFGSTLMASAQLYDSSLHYYIEAGASLSSNPSIQVVKFDGSNVICTSDKLYTFRANIENDSYYYDDYLGKGKGGKYKYNSSISTSKREVYETSWAGTSYIVTDPMPMTMGFYNPNNPPMPSSHWVTPKLGMIYRGFATDKSSYIFWKERKNSGEIVDKKHYVEVKLNDLKPKGARRDFLDD